MSHPLTYLGPDTSCDHCTVAVRGEVGDDAAGA
jgi:hypothetical protein